MIFPSDACSFFLASMRLRISSESDSESDDESDDESDSESDDESFGLVFFVEHLPITRPVRPTATPPTVATTYVLRVVLCLDFVVSSGFFGCLLARVLFKKVLF